MDSVFDTESSSGCESGWTLYLDHDSFLSPCPSHNEYITTDDKRRKREEDEDDDDEEEEEDLSMVSDASSGPPHFHEDEDYANEYNNGFFCHASSDATLAKNNEKRKKDKEHRRLKVQEKQLSFLDDTASSPIYNIATNKLKLTNPQAQMELDFSQGYSTTQFEDKSRFQEHYGFFQSSVSGTQLQKNQWFERKRVGMR